MDERTALPMLESIVSGAGDDAAVIDGLVLTIDMLHDRTDFPPGTTRYTAGWRSVAASLSDVAAMGGAPTATVAAYGAPALVESELREFVRGAKEVSNGVGGEYVGGDLDIHGEFTVTTAAVGRAENPVYRRGCQIGDRVCVTGTLGRTAGALAAFETGETDRGNELFRFRPRVDAGLAVAPYVTSMMDISDGIARSLYQLVDANGCGFAIDWDAIPVHRSIEDWVEPRRRDGALHTGEDFELLMCVPESAVEAVKSASPIPISVIGVVTDRESGVTIDGEPLRDRGYTHGGNQLE